MDSQPLRTAEPASVQVVLDHQNQATRIGHGGSKGSSVYLIRIQGRERALKSCVINPSEAAFVAAAQTQLVPDPRDDEACEQAGLAMPIYVTQPASFRSAADAGKIAPASAASAAAHAFTGIAMPRYDFSMHRLLIAMSAEEALDNPIAKSRSTQSLDGTPVREAPRELSGATASFTGRYGPPNDDASTSSDDSGAPVRVFHTLPKQRRIASVVAIAAVLEQVVAGLHSLHSLRHTFDGAEYKGFRHQDLRTDNILLRRDGRVALCDFELVGHVSADGECRTERYPTCSRLLPLSFHPPEGPNRTTGDVWLLGLIAVELYTGVWPLIDSVAAFDDFGDGPLLHVDANNGIDWRHIRHHVHHRIRRWPTRRKSTSSAASSALMSPVDPGFVDPFIAQRMFTEIPPLDAASAGPSDDVASPSTDATTNSSIVDPPTPVTIDANLHLVQATQRIGQYFEDFCARCLTNDPRKRATVDELMQHELFAELRRVTNGDVRAPVRQWIVGLGTSAYPSPATRTAAEP